MGPPEDVDTASVLAIPELKLQVLLPVWYKDAEDDLTHKAPNWPDNFERIWEMLPKAARFVRLGYCNP